MTTFDGLVGNTTILGAIDISGTGGLDLDAAIAKADGTAGAASLDVNGATNLGANVITTGAQTYTGAVTLSANTLNQLLMEISYLAQQLMELKH